MITVDEALEIIKNMGGHPQPIKPGFGQCLDGKLKVCIGYISGSWGSASVFSDGSLTIRGHDGWEMPTFPNHEYFPYRIAMPKC